MSPRNIVAPVLIACILASLALTAPAGAATAGPPVSKLDVGSDATARAGSAALRSRLGSPRIVGGNTTDNSKYPWQAQVWVETTEGTFFCGGSLLTPFIVITAAHCLVNEFGEFDEILNVEVWLGATFLLSGGEFEEVSSVWKNNGFNPEGNAPQFFKNDVAFVALKDGSARPTIQIAGPTERPLWTPGRANYVTGWGTTSEGGELSPILKEAVVPIVDDATCAQPGVYGIEFDPATMVCAGYIAGGTDSCQGDSGGPLQSPIDGGGFRLTGIVSWGEGCARPNKPGVYTRIGSDPLQSFISQGVAFIEAEEGFPPVNVIGAGARPLGCGAAEASMIAASTVSAAAKKALKRAKATARRAKKALRSAKRAARIAQRTGHGIGPALKRLKKASSKAKTAGRKLRKASKRASTTGAAAAAATANKLAVCGA